MRICARGHHNARGAQFCAECGSTELSQSAPSPSLLYRISGAVLYVFSGVATALLVMTPVLALLYTIDWSVLSGPLVSLVLMVALLYWTTTLIPGPVKKVGKAAGRAAMKSIRKREGGGR